MSKRLQVLIPEAQYEAVEAACLAEGRTIAQWIRESIDWRLAAGRPEAPGAKLARILGFAKYSAPVADIETILAQIDSGKNQP